MTNFNLASLWRSTVGFDRLFDMLEDDTFLAPSHENYPLYNIERTGDDAYAVTLAVAGFAPNELTLIAEQNLLTVEGQKTAKNERHYLHQGISARAFRRQFTLADYMKVSGANYDNGLLRIELVREIPEAMKPRRIAIGIGPSDRDGKQLNAA